MTVTVDDLLASHPSFVLREDDDPDGSGYTRQEIEGVLAAARAEVDAYLSTSGAPIDALTWLDQAVIDIAAWRLADNAGEADDRLRQQVDVWRKSLGDLSAMTPPATARVEATFEAAPRRLQSPAFDGETDNRGFF